MTLLLSSLLVLLGGAVTALILARLPRVGLLAAMGAIVLASVLAIVSALLVLGGKVPQGLSLRWPLPLGEATLAMDGLSAWFVLTIGLLSAAVAIYAARYMQHEIGHASVPLFSMFLCLLVASMYVLVCATDAVLFLVSWEAMTLVAFFLVNLHHHRAEVRYGAWMYIVATHLGTALFLLPMFALLVAQAGGSAQFGQFRAALAGAGPILPALIFLLGMVGFGTKAGFMPMHVWLPNAHPVAPSPVSALLSGVVIKTGIYGLLRTLSWLPPLPVSCAITMLVLAMVSGVLGVLYAMAQHDIKRLLAYHSVENIGIIGLGVGIGMLGQTTGHPALAAVGYAGALLHVLNHALFKGLLFLSAGSVIHSTGTGEIDRLGGLARKTPLNALLFLVAAVSICGLPPFNGFVSEWLIYGSLFHASYAMTGSPAAGAVLALTALALMGGLALACFAKVFSVVFLGESRHPSTPAHPTPRPLLLAMGMLGLLCLLIGLMPSIPVALASQAATTLTHGLRPDLSQTIAPAWKITLLAGVFGSLLAALALLRGRTPAVAATAPQPTWGCGYAFPTPRMQYTASSFAGPLIGSFRVLLWPQVHCQAPQGPFPTEGHLATHTPDVAEHDVFAPLFRLLSRLARMIKTVSLRPPAGDWERHEPQEEPAPPIEARPFRLAFVRAVAALRRGSIQICLTYIVTTMIVIFIVEAVTFPKPRPDPAAQPPGASAPSSAVSLAQREGIRQ